MSAHSLDRLSLYLAIAYAVVGPAWALVANWLDRRRMRRRRAGR